MLTGTQISALAPLLILGGTVVALMLSISLRRSTRRQAFLAGAGMVAALAALFVVSGLAPIQLTALLILDQFAVFDAALVLVTALVCVAYAREDSKRYGDRADEMFVLMTIATLGGLVLVSARHFATLFIGIELMSVSAYGLVGYVPRSKYSLEAGAKYLLLSAAASGLLLFGMALIYAASGSLSFANSISPATGLSGIHIAGIVLLFAGLAFKLSLAPFHAWTPDVYEGAPLPVVAFLATTGKLATFAAMLRFLFDSGVLGDTTVKEVLIGIAVMSIIAGNLLAIHQQNLKRMLGYSSIAHFGYVAIAIVANSRLTTEAVHAYLLTYALTTLTTFGVMILKSATLGARDADNVDDYRGLIRRRPDLAALMCVCMLSFAGIPLTAGFIGKFYVVAAGALAQQWLLLATVIAGSAIGLYYYLRVIVTVFLPEINPLQKGKRVPFPSNSAAGVALLVVALAMFFVALYPGPALEVIQRAALAAYAQ